MSEGHLYLSECEVLLSESKWRIAPFQDQFMKKTKGTSPSLF